MTINFKRLGSVSFLCAMLVFLGTQVAFAVPTTPSSDFINNKDGTVTHKKTGLTWMRCQMGKTWTGSYCSGKAITYTHDQAVALTTIFSGKNDWRLPSIAELQTIVERESYHPAINKKLFPHATSNRFWSSSPYAGDTNAAWIVNFSYGDSYGGSKNYSNAVRLVRGGQFTFNSLTTPDSDFTDNQDGTVTHKITGLMWMRCVMGQTWDNATSTCTGTTKSYTYAQAVDLTRTFAGQSDWRLPNENELLSIVEYSTSKPALNTTVFPKTLGDWFWSSSLHAKFTGYAWIVYFDDGHSSSGNKFNGYAIRLVRGGQRDKMRT